LIDNHSDGAYAVLRFTAACPHAPEDLQVTYRLFSGIDPQHKGLLRLEAGGATPTAIFGPKTAQQTFKLGRPSPRQQFLDYLATGVEHIWNGYDHILFLLSLLLPAVVVRDKKRWVPSEGFRTALIDVLKNRHAFTVAHSITLSLATLQVVSLPARISESAIAMSVVLAPLNNLFPIVRSRRWVVAFCFGLIHGFGFASVLTDLRLPRGVFALALVGFNVGVEVGKAHGGNGRGPLRQGYRGGQGRAAGDRRSRKALGGHRGQGQADSRGTGGEGIEGAGRSAIE
jgi:hypothetical protein